MRIRTSLALAAIAATTVGVAPSFAAVRRPRPKPVPCLLVKDAGDDAGLFSNLGTAATNDPNLDVLSADVNVDAKNIALTVRVKDLTAEPAQMSPAGRTWITQYTIGGQTFGITVTTGPAGTNWPEGYSFGALDVDHDEIRVTIPIAKRNDAALLKKGTKLQNIHVQTLSVIGLNRAHGAGDSIQMLPADDAKATGDYVVGTNTCAKFNQ